MTSAPDTEARVAIVSGTSSGIGAAVAEAFLRRGYTVVGLSRRGNKELSRHESYADCPVDLRDQQATRTALEPAVFAADAVVINAGVSPGARSLAEVSWPMASETYESNVRTALNLIQAAAPLLQRRGGGSLTFVGASIANGLVPDRWAYAASKAAMTALMRACSVEYAASGIVSNEVRPGPVGTPMTLGTDGAEVSDHILSMINAGFRTDWLKPAHTVADWIVSLAEFPPNGPTGQIYNYSRKAL